MLEDTNKDLENYIADAEPPASELKGDVQDSKDSKPDTKPDNVPDSSGNDPDDGEAVVRKAMEDAGILEKADDEEGKDIPDEFTNACLEQGWTKEDIIDFATGLEDKELLALLPEMFENIEDKKDGKDDKQDDSAKKGADKGTKKAADKAAKAGMDNEEIALLKKEINALKEKLAEGDELKAVQEHTAILQAIDEAFDEASEDFEIFGKTDELLKFPAGPKKGQYVPTTEAYKARQEVYTKALPFIKEGIPVKDSMEIALTWYKGKNLERDVKRNVIKDLKKHEQKLSAKRSGKETVKVYENEDDRKADVVREAARKAGVKGRFGL